jgi:alpha-tubulin suppressor-like RCC1 family protein
VQVSTLANIIEISGGVYQNCARRNDGTVWCWGHNTYGSLGDGSTAHRTRPVQAQGITTAVQSSVSYTTCARLANGSSWCWGYNANGQVGDGTTTQRTTPTRVRNDAGFIDLRTVHAHTCARKADGTLMCWGRNQHGQLGDGTTSNRSTPVQVRNVSDATTLALPGHYFTCAIRTGGLLWCWGYNGWGQVGDGSTTNRSAPVRVNGLGAVTHVAQGGGFSHSNLARTATGETYAWGHNYLGSLGLGDATNRDYRTPQRVAGF